MAVAVSYLDDPERRARLTIAEQNDLFRRNFAHTPIWDGEVLQGQVLITPGITALPQHIRIRLMAAVIDFRAFDAENDVWEDHSFGIVKLDGVEAFWKIDLLNLCGDGFGALTVEDAINPMLTRRFLTIGLRSED